jgi:hypothetical protein
MCTLEIEHARYAWLKCADASSHGLQTPITAERPGASSQPSSAIPWGLTVNPIHFHYTSLQFNIHFLFFNLNRDVFITEMQNLLVSSVHGSLAI